MATTFGKELRKLRIDYDDTIVGMANKLKISTSYLSAIESGKRNIPSDMVDCIVKIYGLSIERRDELRQAEAESSTNIDIDLSKVSDGQKKLIFALSRKLDGITEEQCAEILKKLT